jgi:hypothetical protein
VATYHQLADRLLRARGEVPDFSQPGAFARLEAALDAHQPTPAEQVDELIIDEGQDFRPAWADNLLRFLRPGGRAWWLEDPLQNLYDRPPVALPGWVGLRADTNYRSPKDILATLNRLLASPVAAGSPSGGARRDVHLRRRRRAPARHRQGHHPRHRPGLPPPAHRGDQLPRPRALGPHAGHPAGPYAARPPAATTCSATPSSPRATSSSTRCTASRAAPRPA